MSSSSNPGFAKVIRERRRQLDLTQEEVANRVDTSVPYIGLLESGKRHPSEKVVAKLAAVLGLDPGELFFMANPTARSIISSNTASNSRSAWEAFSQDNRLRKIHNITDEEMQALSQVALMGEVRQPRDFVFVLNTIRHVLGQ
jgi:transcriptional regulator with XRE-family HTH domain